MEVTANAQDAFFGFVSLVTGFLFIGLFSAKC